MTEETRSGGELARGAPVRGWRAVFPPAQWLPTDRHQWLAHDAVAGVTLAAYAIPVSLAYASLAGLPAGALQAAGVTLRLVAAHAAVRDLLRAEGLEERVGYFGRRIAVADAVDEFRGRTETASAAAAP